jgi:hypothetical protein
MNIKSLNLCKGDNVLITYNVNNPSISFSKLATYTGSTKGVNNFFDTTGKFQFTNKYLEVADITMEVIEDL